MRVHELAKELKVSSKDLIEKLKGLKIDAKSHMSVLTEENVRALKEKMGSRSGAKASVGTEKGPEKPVEGKGRASSEAMPSIESVKRELLLRRSTPKAPAAPVKKIPQAITRRPEVSAIHSEPKKPIKPVIKPMPPKAPIMVAPVVAPVPPPPTVEVVRPAKKIEIDASITVKDLAVKLSLRPNDLIQRLIKANIFASINQSVNFEIAQKIATEMGFEVQQPQAPIAETAKKTAEIVRTKDHSKLSTRAPIVTFMGHVDHGKTSLLDAIRNTKVAASEAGGITQHIGAYEVFLPKGAVTFLDTPGHEAFTAMRARGARATDIVVLVVAADDGVMPQTIEAIDHAKAAAVPIIVAINKIDLPSANVDRVKKELMEHGLMSEDWGGKTIMVGVSAKRGDGIDDLLEMLVLESELLELKADLNAPAQGIVIEAELSKESGVLATVLVQEGTLHLGDLVVAGSGYCRVRAMINDRGARIAEALPSMPVEILGLSEVPKAGDRFFVVDEEKKAKDIVEERTRALREKSRRLTSHITLEHLSEEVKAGKSQELKLIVKADVQGSVEAIRSTLDQIQSKSVRLIFIHTGVGDVSESDVMLAAASDAVIIGFHVQVSDEARRVAEEEAVDLRLYQIIYEVKSAIERAMEGLLEPVQKEIFVGMAEVRQVFKVSKVGSIAGCMVQKGKIIRNHTCRVLRSGKKVHDGKIESLKRFKDDAREVLEGFECGIGVSNFPEIASGDRIEVYEIQEHARKLE